MQITRQQDHLLRAILEPTDDWVGHFHACQISSIEELDTASFDLLPMLYQRLASSSIVSPLYPKLQGIYRYTWAYNTKRFSLLKEILKLTEELHIPTLLIKGAALAFSHYPHVGLRQMTDSDLVVREEQIPELLEVLLKKGFKSLEHRPIEKTFLSTRYRRVEHGLCLTQGAVTNLDLHWHVLDECCTQEADDHFWNGAIDLEVQGARTRTLNPTDHLLLIALHGLQSHTLRWILDASVILKKNQGEINWGKFCQKAVDWHLTLPLRSALSILKQYGNRDLDMPIQSLSLYPSSLHDRIELRHRLKSSKNLWHIFLGHWFKHCRRERKRSFFHNSLTFGRYFKDRCDCASYFSLPAALITEVKGIITRRRKNASNH